MIMPFLRLVIIYIVVACAAVVFFNRDTVLPMIGWPWFGGDSEISVSDDAQESAEPAAVAPIVEPVAEPDESAAEPQEANAAPEAPEAPTATAEAPAPVDPAEPAENTTSETPANADAQLQEMRSEARQAYWQGDLAKTERMYKEMAAANPDNVDILGELGNLYFTQRRMDDAATYYHLAAKQLISQGKTGRAMPLIGVLQNIAPAKANELRSLVSASQ